MKKLSIFIFILCLASVSFAQKAELQVTLRKSTCGEFLAYMDGLIQNAPQEPNSKIYLVYYGERFRKTFSKEKGDVIILEYAHRDDGLNWAKAIPFYMSAAKVGDSEESAENIEWDKKRKAVSEKIVLLDGGFRENIEIEIWFAPPGAQPPTPTPTIAEKDIKFRTDKPRPVPDFTCCYCGY